MICKYCRRDGVLFDRENRRWECSFCHLSSSNFDTVVHQENVYDNLPLDDVVIEAILDDDDEPKGFVQRYIPDADRIPNLKVNVERARLLRWILQKERKAERDWGNQWFKDNGFEIVDERKDRRGRKIYVWEKED